MKPATNPPTSLRRRVAPRERDGADSLLYGFSERQKSPDDAMAQEQLVVEGGTIRCAGDWRVGRLGPIESRLEELRPPGVPEMTFDVAGISSLDTSGAWLLRRTIDRLRAAGRSVALKGASRELEALLSLVAESRAALAERAPAAESGLERVGRAAWRAARLGWDTLAFVG